MKEKKHKLITRWRVWSISFLKEKKPYIPCLLLYNRAEEKAKKEEQAQAAKKAALKKKLEDERKA